MQFGGSSHAGSSITDPVYEIWSCSLALSKVGAADLTQADVDAVAGFVSSWFSAANTHICVSESLDFVKVNEVDMATGHQITDPTLEHLFTAPPQGASSARNPVGTSCRISMDDGTRNPRHRGGFYMPRLGVDIPDNGRIPPTQLDQIATSAQTLLQSINAYAGLGAHVAVWSRKGANLATVSRIRVGDVPDNISRRRNKMREAYSIKAL